MIQLNTRSVPGTRTSIVAGASIGRCGGQSRHDRVTIRRYGRQQRSMAMERKGVAILTPSYQ